MGQDQRSGHGHGMDLVEAGQDFINQLNAQYGEQTYSGGGNSITEWIDVRCVKEPTPYTSAVKSKKIHLQALSPGRLVNGFRITNETSDLMKLQLLARRNGGSIVNVIEKFALTKGEATKVAENLAMHLNSKVQVVPTRLWQDDTTKRLSLPIAVMEVSPIGGQEARPGTWHFEVEVRV